MTAGTDPALQALLDPSSNGTGITIVRRMNSIDGLNASYYCTGNVTGVGKALWVDLLISDDDATHDTAVRAAFNVA